MEDAGQPQADPAAPPPEAPAAAPAPAPAPPAQPAEDDHPESHRGEGGAAPPDYNTFHEYPDASAPQYEVATAGVDEAALYGEFKIEGMPPAPAIATTETTVTTEVTVHIPYLLYVDFLPRVTSAGYRGRDPKFDTFRSLMGIVNYWLSNNPYYRIFRVESIVRNVHENTGVIDSDSTIYTEGTKGTSTYVRGIRLWVLSIPPGQPVQIQQIGYTNIVPLYNPRTVEMETNYGGSMRNSGDRHVYEFEDIDKTLERFNATQRIHPLPGKVITVETIHLKYHQGYSSASYDPDQSFWQEKHGDTKCFLTFLRCFYVMGPQCRELIGLQDFVPEITSQASGFAKFEPYDLNFVRATNWLAAFNSKGMLLTNIQTLAMKVEKDTRVGVPQHMRYQTHPRETTFQVRETNQFVNVIRVGYAMMPPGTPPIHSNVITTKLFVPVRLTNREAEPMSATLQRINQWLQLSGARLIGIDTLRFEVNPVKFDMATEDVSFLYHQTKAHMWMTTLRLYFDGPIQEPPPHLLPPVKGYSSIVSTACCTIQ